ncbi:MAG: hypothetical protein RSD38_05105, partial [Raoultibacter sp.]
RRIRRRIAQQNKRAHAHSSLRKDTEASAGKTRRKGLLSVIRYNTGIKMNTIVTSVNKSRYSKEHASRVYPGVGENASWKAITKKSTSISATKISHTIPTPRGMRAKKGTLSACGNLCCFSRFSSCKGGAAAENNGGKVAADSSFEPSPPAGLLV